MTGPLRILVIAAALAATGGAAPAAGPDPEPAGPAGQQPVETVEPDQAARYGVLRRPATSRDRLPEQAVEFVHAMMTTESGAAPRLARRAQVTAAGRAVYVIPGRGSICLYATAVGTGEGGGSCNRTGETLQGFLLVVDFPAPGITRIAGLVPDGVGEVRLRGRDGEVQRVVPVENSYVFETARAPGQVEWGDAVMAFPEGLGT